MEGAWRILPAGRSAGDRDDKTRVVIETPAATAVGTDLGIVELLPTVEEERVVGHLGPDLLGNDWDPIEAARRLSAEPNRPIGEALLDQKVMAGLGNIFRCELCFLRGIDPSTPVGLAGSLEEIVDLARRVLMANRTTGNQVTTGDPRRGRSHWVYGRVGRPCRRCATIIRKRADGTGAQQERVTYWCPSCQPLREANAR